MLLLLLLRSILDWGILGAARACCAIWSQTYTTPVAISRDQQGSIWRRTNRKTDTLQIDIPGCTLLLVLLLLLLDFWAVAASIQSWNRSSIETRDPTGGVVRPWWSLIETPSCTRKSRMPIRIAHWFLLLLFQSQRVTQYCFICCALAFEQWFVPILSCNGKPLIKDFFSIIHR